MDKDEEGIQMRTLMGMPENAYEAVGIGWEHLSNHMVSRTGGWLRTVSLHSDLLDHEV